MLYALASDEVTRLRRRLSSLELQFAGAEKLQVFFRTDPDVVARIVPKPLRPADEPRAVAFVARYPETNFGLPYDEGALFVEVRWGKERGLYCLAMPVTDDMALIGGREVYGFPKKLADRVTLDRSGASVAGSVVRKGTEVLRIEATLTGPAAPADLDRLGREVDDGSGRRGREAVCFNYKFFPSAAFAGFDAVPRLVRTTILDRPRPGLQRGTARVTLRSSSADPLGDVPVVGEPLACVYGVFDSTLRPGRAVAHAWLPWSVLPYAFFKDDSAVRVLSADETSSPPRREAEPLPRRSRGA